MMYVQAYTSHTASFEINVQFYIGLWLLISFLRQLLSWTATRTLGPIISTIIVMFKDVGQFIIIWIFVLFGFSSVGIITLNKHPRMKSFSSSLLFFFEVAFGNYDLDSIEEIWGD